MTWRNEKCEKELTYKCYIEKFHVNTLGVPEIRDKWQRYIWRNDGLKISSHNERKANIFRLEMNTNCYRDNSN